MAMESEQFRNEMAWTLQTHGMQDGFDFDGLDLDQSGDGRKIVDDLDEYQYVERTIDGYNS